jgi:indole-3-glycerol phosphate synthase
VQASPAWNPPVGVLGGIVAEARVRAQLLRGNDSALREAAERVPLAPAFATALRAPSVAVIAEAKRRAPSKGWIKPGMSAVDQALAYEAGGAAAISVLTEPNHFGGSAEDLLAVRAAVRIPALKKDFHVDPIQLVEAKALGASAALVIVRALSPAELVALAETARSLDLELLVEIRDQEEFDRAMDIGAGVIGINNRNLETLEIDPSTSERMLPLIPPGIVAVAESGISQRADVERVARCGADAVLVGSSISSADDPCAAVRNLSIVPRVARGH